MKRKKTPLFYTDQTFLRNDFEREKDLFAFHRNAWLVETTNFVFRSVGTIGAMHD